MSAHQAVFPVAVMARVLGVSEAGYHALATPLTALPTQSPTQRY